VALEDIGSFECVLELILCSCIECEIVEGLDALNGGGWGVFIGRNHIIAIGYSSLSSGAPDSPVRTEQSTIHYLVPATSVTHWSRPLDSPVPVAHRTVRGHTGQSSAT
jgi:hypothetical protein